MNKIMVFLRESSTARFFIPLGLVLIVFGVAMFIINTKNEDYIKTEAVVSKTELVEPEHTDIDGNTVEATYKIFVKYTVDGKEYNEELGDLPDAYRINEKMTIYYNPDDPSEITQTKSKIIPIVMIVLGCTSFVGGIVSGVNSIKNYKKMNEQEKGWSK